MPLYSPPLSSFSSSSTSTPGFTSSGLFRHHSRTILDLADASRWSPDDPDDASEVYSLAFSPSGRMLAVASTAHAIRVYSTETGALRYSLLTDPGFAAMPCTALRFRPAAAEALGGAPNVLLVACADGSVSHWHVPSQTCLFRMEEPDNQIFAADFAPDGAEFVTAGSDCQVRLYDEATKTVVRTFASVRTPGHVQGHSNRIFAAKFHPLQRHTVVTGGWDNTVQLWDARTGTAVGSIFGPHICGDALDLSSDGSLLLTGSCRPDRPCEIWDLRKLGSPSSSSSSSSLSASLPLPRVVTARASTAPGFSSSSSFAPPAPPPLESRALDLGDAQPGDVSGDERVDASSTSSLLVYVCSFSPDDRHIVVGGSGSSTARILRTDTGQCVDRVEVDARGVYAARWSPDGRFLAVTGKAPRAALINNVCDLPSSPSDEDAAS